MKIVLLVSVLVVLQIPLCTLALEEDESDEPRPHSTPRPPAKDNEELSNERQSSDAHEYNRDDGASRLDYRELLQEDETGGAADEEREERGTKSVEEDGERKQEGNEERELLDEGIVNEPKDTVYKEAIELIKRLNFDNKAKGYELLKEAAGADNSKAIEQLAYGYLYGHVLKRNFTKSLELFNKLANKGIPSGQQGLGFMYSMGIGVNSSQAKAILYYTFGALGGNSYSQMVSGYRAFHGVGTPQSCETSLSYYRKVATKVAKEASIFAGTHTISKIRLIEEDEESSVFAGITDDEVDHYKDVFADSGAQLSLGLYYLFGLGGVERNLIQALDLLQRADSPTTYALIGRIYAEGNPPEIPQSNKTAIKYFKRAIEHKTAEGYTGLGIMYFYGLGVEKDYLRAMELFQKGVDKGSPEAHLYIGMGYLYGLGKQINPIRGISSLQIASSQGGHILAQYHLAEAYTKGLNGRKSCNQAVELYKSVAERGKWAWLHREAYRLYMSGDTDSALMMYLHLGELGIEVAQCNAAFMFEEEETDMLNKTEILKRALLLWSRSATQGYSVARVKLGDYYYYGYGTDKDQVLAAEQYRLASDRMGNSQAMFNLAYMYENGIGLQQDYHLAKRYYDLSYQSSPEAVIPVNIALFKMSISFYYDLMIKSLQDDEGYQSVSGWVNWLLGDQWDIYLIAVLCVFLALLVRWYRR